MSLSANDIVGVIMEKAIDTPGGDPKVLKNFHVSQTADQLPDFRLRQAFYRAELERQILEKKEAERKRKEREAWEEERFLIKLADDREKVRKEYLDEIEKRRILQDEAARRQQLFAKRLEEIHEEEERQREEEEKRRQQALIEKRIRELKEAVERKKREDAERRRILFEQLYGVRISSPPVPSVNNNNHNQLALMEDDNNKPPPPLIRRSYNNTTSDYYKAPWNSRDYVHSAIHPDSLVLEDIYFEAPLPMLADVYKKLDNEKKRIKDIMRQRIIQGEEH